MLTIGSLFSGIGGLELGLEWAGLGPTVWQVEQSKFCSGILARDWPEAERYDDVRTVGIANLERVDLVCGGFPCQDVSGAGKGAGLTGERSGLWREFARITSELQPRWVVVENVASGASRWVDSVVRELEEQGYESLLIPLSAADVGAPHKRSRLFIVAHARGEQVLQRRERAQNTESPRYGRERCIPDTERVGREAVLTPVAHADSLGEPQPEGRQQVFGRRPSDSGWWTTEPGVGHLADGLSIWLDRYGGVTDAESKRIAEALLGVWSGHVAQALCESVGRLGSVQTTQVLLAEMRRETGPGRVPRKQLERPATSEGVVRALRIANDAVGAPLRRKQGQQLAGEHPDAVHVLSRLVAPRGEKTWDFPGWEGGAARVKHGVPCRSHRLKALGNAVVPQCAEVVGWIIRELIAEQRRCA